MILINADLHIHSKYSISTSKHMVFQTLASEAPAKGVHLIGTGDCLHEKWLKEIKSLEKVDEGTYKFSDTRFILSAEVQAHKRVHHLILFPCISSVEEFRESIKPHSKNLNSDGRPHVALTGEELGQLAIDVGALFGPCHAFTPWTGVYGYFNNLHECYGDCSKAVSFLELGLSADSNYADRIAELKNITFLSNSDAHSPYPLRLAREFNQFKVNEISFSEIKKAILRKSGRKCILNVGIPPEEGKYNQSACIKCFKKYSLAQSIRNDWKCTCSGRIKKGVLDRINELADYSEPRHPKYRPEYIHIIPLTEIIAKAMNYTNPNCVSVKKLWDALISDFKNEINILLDVEYKSIEQATNNKLAKAIKYFRENRIILYPGGGGRYGQIELPNSTLF